MITKESNRNLTPRHAMKVGDLDLIFAMMQGKLIKSFFRDPWSKFLPQFLGSYLRFSRAIMAFMMWSVIRYKPGYQTMGIITFLIAECFLLGYNSAHVPTLLKPFASFVVPFVPFFKTPEELYRLVFVDIESRYLLGYMAAFTLTSLVHLLTIWTGGNPSLSKRGESWIAKGLSKFMKVNEYVVCGLLEPLLMAGFGLAVWKLAGDAHFGVFLCIIAFSEALQQLLDRALQADKESILRA